MQKKYDFYLLNKEQSKAIFKHCEEAHQNHQLFSSDIVAFLLSANQLCRKTFANLSGTAPGDAWLRVALIQIEAFSSASWLQDVIHQKTRLMFSANPLLVQLHGPLALIIAPLLQSHPL